MQNFTVPYLSCVLEPDGIVTASYIESIILYFGVGKCG